MRNLPLDKEDFKLIMGQLLAILIMCVCEFLIIRDKASFWAYVLPGNFMLFLGFLAYMFFQVYIQRLKADNFNYVLLIMLIGPITTFLLNCFKNSSGKDM